MASLTAVDRSGLHCHNAGFPGFHSGEKRTEKERERERVSEPGASVVETQSNISESEKNSLK